MGKETRAWTSEQKYSWWEKFLAISFLSIGSSKKLA
jgi:hypothetical protein